MEVKKFNQLKREVKKGDIQGLKEVISELTLSQAQVMEDILIGMELGDEENEVLDDVVNHIDRLVKAEKSKKVANKKLSKTEKPEVLKEAPEKLKETKEAQKEGKKESKKEIKPFSKVQVGDIIYLQVEGEDIKHEILVIYKGKKNLVGIMKEDEDEVFLIKKEHFNKLVFAWTDRHGEQYNIKVILK